MFYDHTKNKKTITHVCSISLLCVARVIVDYNLYCWNIHYIIHSNIKIMVPARHLPWSGLQSLVHYLCLNLVTSLQTLLIFMWILCSSWEVTSQGIGSYAWYAGEKGLIIITGILQVVSVGMILIQRRYRFCPLTSKVPKAQNLRRIW